MEAKKIVLIILTILILGPVVFVGSCFPIGLISATSGLNSLIFAFLIGIALAIFVCYQVIKKILK